MFTQQDLDVLYRYCITLNSNPDQAYDLLYSSLEKYYRKPPKEPNARFSYIRRIIKNLWIDNFRKYKPNIEAITPENQEEIAYLVTDLNSLEKELVNEQELQFVWQKLSAEEKEIIYLWVIDCMSIEEIAKHLNIPKNTIISKIYRMRKRLNSAEKNSKIA